MQRTLIPTMDEQKKSPQTEPDETAVPNQEPYVPRPKWQIVAAWFFLILMVLGTILYYYWIAYRY